MIPPKTVGALLVLTLALHNLAGCSELTLDPECTSLATTSAGIVNGVETSNWPAIGALVLRPEVSGGAVPRQFCSGTLIAPDWVLTAAHCLDLMIPTQSGGEVEMTAQMLSFFIGPNVSGEGFLFPAQEIFWHPRFNPRVPLLYDIGLVQLEVPVTHSLARPIPFNTEEMSWEHEGVPITWVGYGVNNGHNQTGNGIKRMGEGVVETVFLDMFAYAATDQGQLPCNGDSGGASLIRFNGQERVAGITHMGDVTCTSAGMDTRVDKYVNWILDITSIDLEACAPQGGDCLPAEACLPDQEGLYRCQPSESNPAGTLCLVDDPTPSCADGLRCLDIAAGDGGLGQACYDLCYEVEDCQPNQICLLGVSIGEPQLGACLPAEPQETEPVEEAPRQDDGSADKQSQRNGCAIVEGHPNPTLLLLLLVIFAFLGVRSSRTIRG